MSTARTEIHAPVVAGGVTALPSVVSYAAAALAKTALFTNRNVADLKVEAGVMPRSRRTSSAYHE